MRLSDYLLSPKLTKWNHLMCVCVCVCVCMICVCVCVWVCNRCLLVGVYKYVQSFEVKLYMISKINENPPLTPVVCCYYGNISSFQYLSHPQNTILVHYAVGIDKWAWSHCAPVPVCV